MSNFLCINKGSKVSLDNSTFKSIEHIELGNSVLSYNFNTKSTEIITVEKIAKSYHTIINRLTFSNEQTVECTTDHPIFTNSNGWCSVNFKQTLLNYNVQVGKLEEGQECLTFLDNKIVFATLISIETIFGDFEMYDISGGQNHCFFANGILVHDENLTELQELNGHFLAHSNSFPH
jgi:Ataxin-1 and HBP1 module (AXH)